MEHLLAQFNGYCYPEFQETVLKCMPKASKATETLQTLAPTCDSTDIKYFLIKGETICRTDDSSLLASLLGDMTEPQLKACREQLTSSLAQDCQPVYLDTSRVKSPI